MDDSVNSDNTIKLVGTTGLGVKLTEPDREICLGKYIVEETGKIYWDIRTSVVNSSPASDQRLMISDEALETVIALRDQINLNKTTKWKVSVQVDDGLVKPIED
jgi:hypothetical protein